MAVTRERMEWRIEKLNPLAFAKSQALTCELTGRPALFSLVVPSQQITLHFVSAELAQAALAKQERGEKLSNKEKRRIEKYQAGSTLDGRCSVMGCRSVSIKDNLIHFFILAQASQLCD